MADNVTLDPGAGGATIATDDDGTAQHQYVKVEFGADNTQTKVTSSVGLPTDPLDRAARDLGKVDIAMGQVAHDAPSAAIDPVLVGGYASAAAPTGVSLDGDAVQAWHLRNGAQCVNLTAAGALIPGDATDGLLINLGANNDVTVTGTVTANLAAGTNNIGDVDILSIAAGDNNIGNVDIVTVPAPLSTTGSGTEATALRVTIATDSTGVLSVDDNGASLTVDNGGTFAVQVDGSALTALQLIDDTVATLGTTTYTEAATKGQIIGAVRRDADTTLVDTTNEVGPLQMDANGRLKVEAFSGETLPVSLASVPSHAVTNAGTFAVQVDGNALTALQLIDNPVVVDDAAFTPATTSVMMAGFEADETATDSVDEGDAGAARMTLDRKQIVNPQPHTAGGLSIFRSLDLDETEEDVKTSAGQVYGVWVTNLATSTRFVKFYNATAANVTVGTTTPVITLPIPGNSSDDVTGLFSSTMGITFDTAICAAATTGIADNDTGAPAANDVVLNVFYK
ncbi:MAG: hypothetical protein OEW25_01455 [Nitrospira sp.]|nr:hypothetical protein [Nitrospira sp.]MDH4327645.1 hypothetical protein [Nitrospira sp.]MDH5251964.1 hypothetical protein [Nitrospira sp.]